jgi:4-oxalocrotonate tautomerase
MPLLQVSLVEGRTAERKEQLIAELSATTARVLDAPLASVRVILTEVPAAHWGVAGVSKQRQQTDDGSPT